MAARVQDWQNAKGFRETNLHMLETQLLCDVTFLVGEQRETVQAHKFILVSRSCVFETMFCGPLSETGSVMIPDIEAGIFKTFLRFMYTNDVSLDADTALDLMYVAKKYSVLGLEKRCVDFCNSVLTPGNACTILQHAFVFDVEELKLEAMDVIKSNFKGCLSTEGFSNLSKDCLNLILDEDDLRVDNEVDVFNAVMTWAEAECRRQKREVTPAEKRAVLHKSVHLIRFPAMRQSDLAAVVCPTGILSNAELVQLFQHYTIPDLSTLPFSGKKRSALVYVMSRSTLRPYTVVDTNRRDGISLIPDKCVLLSSVFLYGGNMSSSANIKVEITILNDKEGQVRSHADSVTVTPDKKEVQVMLPSPVPLQANKKIFLKVACNGPKRYLSHMNKQSKMKDAESGVTWIIKHPFGHSSCQDSLEYGHITGFSYSLM